jgi:hypothetical protein
MQGTTEVQHQIADARLPQAAPVFDDATALPPAVDGRDPAPAPVECRGPGSRGNGRGRGLLAPPGRSPLASWRHRRGGHRAQDWQKGGLLAGARPPSSSAAHVPLGLGVGRPLNVAPLSAPCWPPHPAPLLAGGRGVEAWLLARRDAQRALSQGGARLEDRAMGPRGQGA